ncbi:MAG: UDP-N-acetylmuramoyl-L-alanine--D-glutamate ligase [Actinobacteria bacterium]|nr:UDP-N-acetylmuramoyl-L-alanine--D-glutamate ligase [Actinomycetota bacterium]
MFVKRGGEGLPPSVRVALVLGASRSGLAAAGALAKLGLKVTLSDRKTRDSLPGLEEIAATEIAFLHEDELAGRWPGVDLVVKSPGVPSESVPVTMARRRGVPVWSEVELAYALFPNPFDAVTGTNGKTTTTALLGHLFLTAGRPARILGNIGTAVTSVAGFIAPDEEVVVELSSFQLEDVHAFRPAAGIFLNLTQDHLDRHGSMERYLECKAKLFENQGPEDVAVLNLDDPAVAELGMKLRSRSEGPRVAFFSTTRSGKSESSGSGSPVGGRPDSWIDSGWIFLEGRRAQPVGEIQIPGRHNLENCLAAGTAALSRGVELEAVREGLRTFRGVAHRLETAGIVAGVTYVNDSKATNVEATLTALSAYPQNVHLILGGRDKASDYRPIARACAGRCRAIYLIGEATPLIQDAFREVAIREAVEGIPEAKPYGDLEKAVAGAALKAEPGDVVLLAPACASFDQYRNFEERGEHFRRLVTALGPEER